MIPCKNVDVASDIGPVNIVPVDPTQNITYTVLQKLITEFASVFGDEFLHVGGDEMQLACWDDVPHIQTFMKVRDNSVRPRPPPF